MKKLLAAIIAFAMVLSLAVVPALAERNRDAMLFSVDEVTADPGENVDVFVYLTGGEYECHILNMSVNYDPNVLEFVSRARGDVLNQVNDLEGTMVIDANTPGRVAIGVIMPTDPFTVTGTLIKITFHVKDDAEPQVSPVTLDVEDFKYMPIDDMNGTPIPFETQDGSVTVNGEIVTEAPVPPTDEPVPPTDEPVPPTDEPVPPTDEPVPPTDEPVPPTDEPVPPTDEPVPPTDEPVEPTDEPVEPTEEPTTPPVPPTGAVALVGAGVAAIAAGAGVVIFRKKED